MGSSVVNALSAHMDLKVYRDGCIYHDEYEKGRPVIKLENGLLPVIGKTRRPVPASISCLTAIYLRKPVSRRTGLRAACTKQHT